jgi:hypothetical protein
MPNLTFQDVSLASALKQSKHYTHGCAAADYDNDGFTDLLITGYGGLALWHNQGDGTFVEETLQAQLTDSLWSSSAGWGDVDGDGALDLYVAHYVNWSFENDPPCQGATGIRDVCPPRQFEPLDDTLYLGNGDGTFRDGTRAAGLVPGGKGLGVLLADLDDDSDLDIYVANDTTNNFLYLNDGSGRFEERGVVSGTAMDEQANANGSMGVALLDFNHDCRPDLWVTNYEDEVFALYRNDADGAFLHVSARVGLRSLGSVFVGFGCVAGDFDLDGDEDLAIANGHVIHHPRNAPTLQQPLLLVNEGGRQFSKATEAAGSYFAQPHAGRGLAQGDFDGDGDLDLVFANNHQPAAMLWNTTPTEGRSLSIRLVGNQSNRDCVGARVILKTSAGLQLRQVAGGGSYLSTSDLTLHFGIPAGSRAQSLLVKWPGGRSEEIPLSEIASSRGPGSQCLMVFEAGRKPLEFRPAAARN